MSVVERVFGQLIIHGYNVVMSNLFNPDYTLYKRSVDSEIHIDKSLLIRETNRLLSTDDLYVCVSRPRRFGKSMAAHMLMAYYSRGCDAREIFKDKKIASEPSFERHLNKYNVIHLVMTDYVGMGIAAMKAEVLSAMKIDIEDEVENLAARPEFNSKRPFRFRNENNINQVLQDFADYSGAPFVFIIDEWDALMRETAEDEKAQKEYLDFLKVLLKDKPYVALAYMTGILPVKKYGAQSALNMFTEYSMERARPFSEYFGFTKDEVAGLCGHYNLDMNEVTRWYDGYLVDEIHIYNPRSLVLACRNARCDNYWTRTETYEALKRYIVLDVDGLREKVNSLIAGGAVTVNTLLFQNDMINYHSADDVLTLLIHLGYLTYDNRAKTCWIPNNEVAVEFVNSIEHEQSWMPVMKALEDSERCLKALLAGDGETVAALVERCHQENTSIIRYNDENSLACVVALAFYTARNRYFTFRELPSGKGYADIAFIPRPGENLPALVIELKAEKSASIALDQIRHREYPAALADFTGEMVLAGINYSTDSADDGYKHHTCIIERWCK